MNNNDIKVGVNPIILNINGEILLGRRLKKYGNHNFRGKIFIKRFKLIYSLILMGNYLFLK